MYFSWEETTIAVRAFTHGYDLFHPAAVVTWHEYTRAYRVKHWDDHTGKQDGVLPWYRLHQQAIAKVADFFANPMVGPFGLGPERTFADYEDYAGVSFRHRRVQDYTRLNKEPPNPPTDPGWAERVRDHRIEIAVDIPLLPEAATKDPVLWYIGIHDSDGRELYRQDAERRGSGSPASRRSQAGQIRPAVHVRSRAGEHGPCCRCALPQDGFPR